MQRASAPKTKVADLVARADPDMKSMYAAIRDAFQRHWGEAFYIKAVSGRGIDVKDASATRLAQMINRVSAEAVRFAYSRDYAPHLDVPELAEAAKWTAFGAIEDDLSDAKTAHVMAKLSPGADVVRRNLKEGATYFELRVDGSMVDVHSATSLIDWLQ